MARPLVSVISLTYNQAEFVEPCLTSLRSQICDDWEHIVIDDGSADGTVEAIRTYADRRTTIISRRHVGVAGLPRNYQEALSRCRGQYVAFLDGDDYWSPNHLSSLSSAFVAPDVVLAYGLTRPFGALTPAHPATIPTARFFESYDNSVRLNTPVGSALYALLDPAVLTFAYFLSTLIRRDALEQIGGLVEYPDLPVMDYPTLVRLSLCGPFAFVDEVLGHWRVHPGSTTLQRGDAIRWVMHRFIGDFRRVHAHALPLSDADWQRVDSSWDLSHIHEARRAIERRDWSVARSRFGRVARQGATRDLQAVGAGGFVAAVMHRTLHPDIEWILRSRAARYLPPRRAR